METLNRPDGVPLEAKELIPLIKQRKEMAESLAAKFGDGTAAWFRGYSDMSKSNQFVSDFGFMLELIEAQGAEIKRLQGIISDMDYKLEAAGAI